MAYPEEIVSRSTYKEKIPIDALNTEEYCVTRRIDGKIADNVDILNGRPVLDPDCYRLHDGEFVFYKASLLHQAEYPNEYQLENKNQYKAYHDALKKTIDKAFTEGVTTNISVTLVLDSDPSNLNYWHFVTRTILTGTTVELKNASSYRKLVFSHILCHVLCKEFQVQDTTTGMISPDVYVKAG